MNFPVVTLLTDFGLRDHFAGVLRGCVLSVCPTAQVADISHEVTAFDILEGAFLLAQAWRYFPRGTVHVIVIDPGVGSNRRPIVAQAGGHLFVAPDNGVLSPVYAAEDHVVRHLTESRFFRHPVSQTFHGRDIFAPVAGHLASGAKCEDMGPVIHDYIRLPLLEPVQQEDATWIGTVLKIDHYGNLITNFRAADFLRLYEEVFEIRIGHRVIARLERNYASAKAGELFLIEGSSGYLEIAASQASTAQILNCGVGAELTLCSSTAAKSVR